MQKVGEYMKEVSLSAGKENVKNAIIVLGKNLIKKADEITNDLRFVESIEINAKIEHNEFIKFNVKKNYLAETL